MSRGVTRIFEKARKKVSTAGLLSSVPLGVNYIAVSKGGNDATGTNNDLGRPFLTVASAYAKAKTLLPNSTKRIQVVIFAGVYAENVTFDTDYIDVVSGMIEGQMYDGASNVIQISSAYGLSRRPVNISGTVTITCNHITFKGINCNVLSIKDATAVNTNENTIIENCVSLVIQTDSSNIRMSAKFIDVHCPDFFTAISMTIPCSSYVQYCTGDAGSFSDFTIYTQDCLINDCIFIGDNCFIAQFLGKVFNSRFGNNFALLGFSGYAQNVVAGMSSFAGYPDVSFSGIAIDCIAVDSSFGGQGGTFEGTAIRCTGRQYCFGSSDIHGFGFLSTGYAEKCTAGDYSYGGQQLFAGKAIDCEGTDYCFTYGDVCLFSGIAVRCNADNFSFSNFGSFQGQAYDCNAGDYSWGNNNRGYCRNCTGGDYCWGISTALLAGDLSGIMQDCTGSEHCFASQPPATLPPTLTGTCINCSAGAGGLGAFATGGSISGSLFHCTSGAGFGKSATNILASSLFDNCISNDINGFNDDSYIEGTVRYCIGFTSVAGKHALRLKSAGKALFCKFTATTGNSIYAQAGATCEIVNCYSPQGISLNITNSAMGEGSGYPECGFMYYVNNAIATPIVAINTPVKVRGTTVSGTLKNFTMPATNRLKYIGKNSVTVTMHVSICVNDYYPTIRKLTFYLAKNGAIVASSGQSCGASTGLVASTDDSKNVSLHYITTLITNDEIEVWVENNTAIQDITVQDLHVAFK